MPRQAAPHRRSELLRVPGAQDRLVDPSSRDLSDVRGRGGDLALDGSPLGSTALVGDGVFGSPVRMRRGEGGRTVITL